MFTTNYKIAIHATFVANELNSACKVSWTQAEEKKVYLVQVVGNVY